MLSSLTSICFPKDLFRLIFRIEFLMHFLLFQCVLPAVSISLLLIWPSVSFVHSRLLIMKLLHSTTPSLLLRLRIPLCTLFSGNLSLYWVLSSDIRRLITRWTIRESNSGGARFSAVQTGPGSHSASCTVGTGYFPGVKSGRGVTLTPHPLLVPRSKKRVELYLYFPLRGFVAYKKSETYLLI